MKKMVQRMFNGVFSLVTTCLIMASPVAAVIYATEPVTAMESFSIDDARPVMYTASTSGTMDIVLPEKKTEKNIEKPTANDHTDSKDDGMRLTVDK